MFKKIWYKFLFWLVTTKVFDFLMLKVIPFIRFSVYYAIPENKQFIKWGALERRGYKQLQAGDIILCIDNKKFSSRVIGAATKNISGKEPYFMPSHVALCVGLGTEFEIAEMTHHNYTKSTWEDVCRESTRVVIARCKDWDKEYVNDTIIPMAKSFKNKKYDNRFEMSTDKLACSELPYHADLERRAKLNLEPVIGDRQYITPVGWILGENIEIVWDSNMESF